MQEVATFHTHSFTFWQMEILLAFPIEKLTKSIPLQKPIKSAVLIRCHSNRPGQEIQICVDFRAFWPLLLGVRGVKED